MSWGELEWPDLSPEFPMPRLASAAPSPPDDVPPDIAERVAQAEHRRARGAKLLAACGALLVGAGVILYAAQPHDTAPASAAVLCLLGAGFCVAFPVAALAALLLGPTWSQRQQHYRLARYEGERRAWLARERDRYLAALPGALRAELHRRLHEVRHTEDTP
jgi:hypothetical protein